jgi:hypothetical protein
MTFRAIAEESAIRFPDLQPGEMDMKSKTTLHALLILTLCGTSSIAQNKPYRVGTTAANFLEMGVGSAANAMGGAYVASARDLMSVYWNPAGLAYMQKNEVQFSYQPWIAGISLGFAGAGIVLPRIGTLALGITSMDYGRTGVTTLDMQEGTGETYASVEHAVAFSFARKLAQWFAFGASGKYVSSSIWHMKAGAMAMDLGVMVNTQFFAMDRNREHGMTIGMSISNYGTRMRYDGIDLLRPIDILPDQNGNYKNVEGQYRLQQWEMPLVLRLGFAVYPVATRSQMLTLGVDALHTNNNSESVNLGGEYRVNMIGTGWMFLRVGYQGLFLDESEYGLTFGGGVHFTLLGNKELKVDYAYRDIGVLGNSSGCTLGVTF